jgi:hypothetical protein
MLPLADDRTLISCHSAAPLKAQQQSSGGGSAGGGGGADRQARPGSVHVSEGETFYNAREGLTGSPTSITSGGEQWVDAQSSGAGFGFFSCCSSADFA